MVILFLEFLELDLNDEWVESCGSTRCSENHNIRKNVAMLLWTAMDLNWVDFLDVIDCYRRERVAQCGFCKKCKKCRRFKLLCTEAETITLNSWYNMNSFVVAVTFNCKNYKYSKTLPMTVDILNRRLINVDKKNLIKKKEEEILFNKIINEFRNQYYWRFFFLFF